MKEEIIIKEKEILLSKMKFKTVDLNYENGEEEFNNLSEDLTEILKEKLKELKWDYNDDDLKIYYSLGNSQGDGFMFEGEIITKKAIFNIKHSGNYYHYNSKEIGLSYLIVGKDKKEIISFEFTPTQEKRSNELEEQFNNDYVDLCKELEKIGYAIIEEENENNILRIGFNDFCDANLITGDLIELWDHDYTTKKEKGFIKICDSGNSNIELWIKDFKIKVTDFIKVNVTEEKRIKII